MRRALLLAAGLSVPLAGAAQVDAPQNVIIEFNNFNAGTQLSYINLAACADTAAAPAMNVEWNIPGANSGRYRIFAQDSDPASNTGEDQGFCLESTQTGTTDKFAGLVKGPIDLSAAVQQDKISGTEISRVTSPVGGASVCDTDGETVWVCAHWYSGQGATTRTGKAIGKFMVDLAVPAKTSIRSVGPGPELLDVSWNLGDSAADHYVVTATPVDDQGNRVDTLPVVSSDKVNGSSVKVNGLQNDQRYRVVVKAVSVGGNESEESDPQFGTPRDVDDFWDVYRNAGGREKGGCGAGAAGPVALLAVAGLLATLRRRK